MSKSIRLNYAITSGQQFVVAKSPVVRKKRPLTEQQKRLHDGLSAHQNLFSEEEVLKRLDSVTIKD
ncbi:hypothetical protein [Herbaspirillum rubrisubalbicans]|uniref:hypothetical protein n=1 Tax=Herbaspirillum rubrisubalbicans TaxID=80842 RepID=UPI0015C5298F|nr:hypothetical protein [Herbaspirillum rubrisubalbicans]